MDWSTYYERFYGWAESTQISRISAIDEFGDVSDEVTEVVQNLLDCKACTRLVKRALAYGVRFTASEIDEIAPHLDTVPDELLLTCKTVFTEEHIDSISLYYNNPKVIDAVSKRSGIKKNESIHIRNYTSKINVTIKSNQKPRLQKITCGQFLRALGAGLLRGLIGAKTEKHKGVCNGDCANCPPHYGYRFGRWYYGHGHNYGCEFGGNRGGGNT